MINDVYNEQMVKKEKTNADTLIAVALWTGAVVLSLIAIIFIPMVGPLLAVFVLWGAHYLSSKLKKEYEYTFTNGDLDIDVIYNKSKRKHLITIDCKKILGFDHIKNKAQGVAGIDKVMDCTSGKEVDNIYGITYDIEHKKTRILIEPNEAILKGIKTYTPRSVTGYYNVAK